MEDELDNQPIKLNGEVLSDIDREKLIQYVNDGQKSSELVLKYLSKINDLKFSNELINSIETDFNKAKVTIYGSKCAFLPLIKDKFYRTQIVKFTSEFQFDEDDIILEMTEYNSHLEALKRMSSEEEIAKYISKIENQMMKYSLLDKCHKRANRDLIISSFTKEISPEISNLNDLSQYMILEYFQDTLGDKLTDKKLERLKIIFSRTSVKFVELEKSINGFADVIFEGIYISNKNKNNISKCLGFIIHEYEHLLSKADFIYTYNYPEHNIEEGMADTFSELTINHYLLKHGNIELEGKKIAIDIPYEIHSGYDFENALVRTILQGMVKDKKDTEAIGEYVLGDKMKFLESSLGKEIAKTKDITPFGMPIITTNREEIYNSPNLDFSNIDEKSIYYKRNCILPLFQIQNELKKKQQNGINVISILSSNKFYYAECVAKEYLDGKRFYEIPNEELDNLMRLLYGQKVPNKRFKEIENILNYCNDEINQLDIETIKRNSFSILSKIPILFGREKGLIASSKLEEAIIVALKTEVEKIREGNVQKKIEQNKDSIIQVYNSLFKNKSETNNKIIDCINYFEIEYQKFEKQGFIKTSNDIKTEIEKSTLERASSINQEENESKLNQKEIEI